MFDWLPVTHGESGAEVFRSPDGTRYRKVVGAAATAELAAERDRTAWAHGYGLPTPDVLDWGVTENGGAYLVTGAVDGVPADRLGESGLRAAWPSIVAAVRALHDVPVGDCPYRRDLDTMLSWARAVVSAGSFNRDFFRDEDRDVPAPVLLARVEQQVNIRRRQEALDLVVCHGDLALPNVLVDPGRLTVTGFIDLGRLGVADRHGDLALLIAITADMYPGFTDAADDLAAAYPWQTDSDRLRFYLELDPLTWG
ncbi:APH(3'') family aminoglycoside O-phosphotransferase [Mycobacterium sp. LTG2003]